MLLFISLNLSKKQMIKLPTLGVLATLISIALVTGLKTGGGGGGEEPGIIISSSRRSFPSPPTFNTCLNSQDRLHTGTTSLQAEFLTLIQSITDIRGKHKHSGGRKAKKNEKINYLKINKLNEFLEVTNK